MEKKMYVLLGDVISSRKIKNRTSFQKNLENTYNKLNKKYEEDLFAEFKILKGLDEIGCVLICPDNVYKMIIDILDSIYPNSMRFVLVFDSINTGLEGKNLTKMDGPAFHKAASMMSSLKESKSTFTMSVYNKDLDKFIVDVANHIISLRQKWTIKQRNIIKEYEKTGKQKKVADKYNISQQAVSNHIKNAQWKEINTIETSLTNIMKNIDKFER
jgi:hypothetical protein